MMDFSKVDISVILPVYNCYAAFVNGINLLQKSLKKADVKYELIVVNDGSEINFEEINREALAQNCRLISYGVNKGKGYAVKRGVEAAQGKIIMFMDGDLPFDFGVIEEAVKIFVAGKADIVIGDRTLGSSHISSGTNFRKFGSTIVSKFANLFLLKNIPDTQCGFKAFKKEAAKKIFSKQIIQGYSFDIEILFLARLYNYRLAVVPVMVNKQFGSNVKLIWHGLQIMIDIIKIKVKKDRYK